MAGKKRLGKELTDLVDAGFSGIWIQTEEAQEAVLEIKQTAESEGWKVREWNAAKGCEGEGAGDPIYPVKTHKPLEALEAPHLVVLHNYHRFLGNAVVVQHLIDLIWEGKSDKRFVVVLSHQCQMPPELEKLMVVINHELPDEEALNKIANEIAEVPSNPLTAHWEAARAACGLTRYEAEGAFALSMIKHEEIRPEEVWNLKESTLKKSGLMEMHRGIEDFKNLGGMEALKEFCVRAIGHSNGLKPKGVLLLGVPGTGKSAFAKALGNEVKRPTLIADIGSWKGSLVGETGAKTRRALKIADAVSPCILFMDEIEKAVAGGVSDFTGDSGVSADQLGVLLTWLNDHESDVFVVATSNDIKKLPPEFSRAERWDAVFFLDLPSHAEKNAIWKIHTEAFGLNPEEQNGVEDRDWTGAEIKACCRLARLMEIPLHEASKYIVPVAKTSGEKIEALREWASGKCLSSTKKGIYRREERQEKKVRRNLKGK